MRELWWSKQWRRLLNLIVRLPRASHFYQAMSLDEEHVAMILSSRQHDEQEQKGAVVAPPMSEYTSTVERLDRVIDALGGLTTAVLAAGGAKKLPKVQPQPRPETAFENVKMRQQWEKHRAVVARVLPNRTSDGPPEGWEID